MQRHFDEQIQELHEKLLLMGSLAESMIQAAMRALIERSESVSQEIRRKEKEVNELQIEIDDLTQRSFAPFLQYFIQLSGGSANLCG